MKDILKDPENYRHMGEQIAEAMLSLSLDVQQIHTFRYFFYSDELTAIALSQKLNAAGYRCEIDRGQPDEDSLCFVEEQSLFSTESFNDKGSYFLALAAECGAVFDGWEIATPDERSLEKIAAILSRTHFLNA